MKTKEFNKGREYERIETFMRQRLFMGWGCIIFSLAFMFTSLYNKFETNFAVAMTLLIVGIASLFMEYSERKELKNENKK